MVAISEKKVRRGRQVFIGRSKGGGPSRFEYRVYGGALISILDLLTVAEDFTKRLGQIQVSIVTNFSRSGIGLQEANSKSVICGQRVPR